MRDKAIYTDNLVTIHQDAICFRSYYFPFALSKRVQFTEVDHIEEKPADLSTGKYRIWGTGDLKCWFPLDWKRPSREKIFFLYRKSKSIHIGFTVRDAPRVAQILRERGLLR